MAFTGESKRNLATFMPKTGSGDIGPGHYHNEGLMHKLALEQINPKMKAPFNSGQKRWTKDRKLSPGPGKYNHNSSFDLNKHIKTLD